MGEVSFLQKLKQALGGGPNVTIKLKTSLQQNELRAGEELTGVVRLTGDAPLQLKSVTVCLMTDYLEESRMEDEEGEKGPTTIERVPVDMVPLEVSGPLELGAGETREWPLTWRLPDYTPVYKGKANIWLETRATFEGHKEQVSKAPVFVQPHRFAEPVLGALADLGYTFRDTEVHRQLEGPIPVVQHWQFESPAGKLGVAVIPDRDGVEVRLPERNSEAGFLSRLLDSSKADLVVRFTAYELRGGAAEVARRLGELLRARSA
jgi:sporulation-control protein